MLLRYLKILKKRVFFVIVVIALIIVSSVTKGKTATITAYLAGILMIVAAFSYIMWIIKTPVKKDKDDGV
jgi:Ca2+/Na+ antiporter